jgi:hypothetical protein
MLAMMRNESAYFGTISMMLSITVYDNRIIVQALEAYLRTAEAETDVHPVRSPWLLLA